MRNPEMLPSFQSGQSIADTLKSFSHQTFETGVYACLYVYAPHTCLVPMEMRKCFRSPETGVTDVWEPS